MNVPGSIDSRLAYQRGQAAGLRGRPRCLRSMDSARRSVNGSRAKNGYQRSGYGNSSERLGHLHHPLPDLDQLNGGRDCQDCQEQRLNPDHRAQLIDRISLRGDFARRSPLCLAAVGWRCLRTCVPLQNLLRAGDLLFC